MNGLNSYFHPLSTIIDDSFYLYDYWNSKPTIEEPSVSTSTQLRSSHSGDDELLWKKTKMVAGSALRLIGSLGFVYNVYMLIARIPKFGPSPHTFLFSTAIHLVGLGISLDAHKIGNRLIQEDGAIVKTWNLMKKKIKEIKAEMENNTSRNNGSVTVSNEINELKDKSITVVESTYFQSIYKRVINKVAANCIIKLQNPSTV